MRTGEIVLKKFIKAIEDTTRESDCICIIEEDNLTQFDRQNDKYLEKQVILFDTSWIDKEELCQALEKEFNV